MNRAFLLALFASITVTGADSVTGPAGVYTVTTTGPTTVTSGPGWVRIEWEVEPTVPVKPPPVKPPEPQPPPPGPTTPAVEVPTLSGPIWIAAVYDKTTANTLPQGQQTLLTSKIISSELKALDITWSSWDKSDKGLEPWGPDAGSTYPVLLVIWNQGAKSKTFPLPSDIPDMVVFGKKLRGQ